MMMTIKTFTRLLEQNFATTILNKFSNSFFFFFFEVDTPVLMCDVKNVTLSVPNLYFFSVILHLVNKFLNFI